MKDTILYVYLYVNIFYIQAYIALRACELYPSEIVFYMSAGDKSKLENIRYPIQYIGGETLEMEFRN